MSRLQLHDVRDAAAFVAAITRRGSLKLSFHDREDLEQYLLVELWKLSERYEPGGVSFSTMAGATLRKRVVDWQRSKLGRTKWQFAGGKTYERERPQVVSLDSPGVDRLDTTVGRSGLDDGAPGVAAELRGLQARARRPRGRNRRLGD
jgi:Sigma-70 region 2